MQVTKNFYAYLIFLNTLNFISIITLSGNKKLKCVCNHDRHKDNKFKDFIFMFSILKGAAVFYIRIICSAS